jgi:TolA protein
MIAPSLQRLTILSLAVHVIFFLTTFLVIKHSGRFVMPSPYVVNLIGSDSRTEGRSETQSAGPVRIQPATKESKATVDRTAKTKSISKAEEEHLSDRIAALRAKKKVEKLVGLRNVISLKGSGEAKPSASAGTREKGGGSLIDDYYSKITRDIWQNWVFPDTGNKNLEAIISIRIFRDGSLHVSRIEKSSGSGLFDRSALRAIAKASPVTPPPYEMEIGVRFYP